MPDTCLKRSGPHRRTQGDVSYAYVYELKCRRKSTKKKKKSGYISRDGFISDIFLL